MHLLKILAAATVATLTIGAAWAQTPEKFRIAGIASLSGPYGIVGEEMQRGVQLAIDLRGGTVLGKPIEVMWEDDETKPQPAVQKATRLISSGAEMIYAPVASASTLALQGLADQRKIPLLVTSGSDDKVAVGSRYTFRTSNSSAMETIMSAEMTKDRGLKKIYGVIGDYAAPRDVWTMYQSLLESSGIQIVGVDFPQFGGRDFSVIIDKIAKSDADGVFIVMTGSDSVTYLKQAHQVKLGDSKVQFGTILVDDTIGKAVGDGAIGVESAMRYHFSLDVPANKAFVEAYRAKYNEWPSNWAGEAFDGMAWWLGVVDATGTWDAEAWVDAFAKSRYPDSIEGLKVMRACDHQAEQPGFWGAIVKGTDPLPPYYMQLKKVYPSEVLFKPCN